MLPVALAVACGTATAALLSVRGDARDPASERLLYHEDHLIRSDGDEARQRVVVYRCPDGTAFARKQVDYRDSRTAPAFMLIDARDGYREGLRRSGKTMSVYRKDHSARIDASLDDGRLVADAGFDEFLHAHWDALLARGVLPIRFVVPAFTRELDFKVRSLGKARIDGLPVQTFQLKLGGLLSMVSPRIDVAYDAGTRNLRRYTGVTNVRSDAGKPLKAQIDFTEPPRTASNAQWQAALSEPLTRCKVGY